MIPLTANANINLVIDSESSNTHKLDLNKNRIVGEVDGLEAIKQAIYKILNTERYQYPIYSWNYGIELEDLFGKPKTFIYPELKRRVTEALLQDDRIVAVDGFIFTSIRGSVTVGFTVHTNIGEIKAERTVNI